MRRFYNLRKSRVVKAAALGTGLVFGVAYLEPTGQLMFDVKGTLYSIRNFGNAFYSFGLIGLDYGFNLRGIEFATEEYFERRREIHTRCAKRILSLSVKNKGIYLKFGQYIGNLERIAPKEYTDVLRVLQDSGPQIDFEAINTVFKADFGKSIDEVFDSFERSAVAAASLAQVHRAYYQGKEVAVKVQFPTLRSQFDKDMALMGVLVRTADRILRAYQYKDMNLEKIFNTFRGSLKEELDFTNEMANGKRTEEIFKGWKDVFVPKYYESLSGGRVLTMDFVNGVRINQKDEIIKQGFDPKEVAKILIHAFSRMIFQFGHVHCDAHPGNLLVRPNPADPLKPQLVILDHGFYRNYDAKFMHNYCLLWKSIVLQDYDTMKAISDDFGIGEYYKYLPLVLLWRSKNSKRLGDLMTENDRKSMIKQEMIGFEVINYIMQKIPEHMIFIIRASNLIAIHNATLGGTMRERFLIFTESCYRALYPRWWSFQIHMLWFKVKLFFIENLLAVYRFIYPTNVEIL